MSKFLKQKLRDPELKAMMGPCMISFAIPLFIPGVTLTLVAFRDDSGFSKYSALHVTGMLFLASASLILVVGVIMKCACKSKVFPTDEHFNRMVSTHSKENKKTMSPAAAKDAAIAATSKRQKSAKNVKSEPVPSSSVDSNKAKAETLLKIYDSDSDVTTKKNSLPQIHVENETRNTKRRKQEDSLDDATTSSDSEERQSFVNDVTDLKTSASTEATSETFASSHPRDNRQTNADSQGAEKSGQHKAREDVLKKKVDIAWENENSEKKLTPVEKSNHSVNFLPPIHQTTRVRPSLAATLTTPSGELISDIDTDSYDASDSDSEDDDDVTITVASRGGSTMPEVDAEGYFVDRFNNSLRGASRENSVEISSVISQEEISSEISEIFEETKVLESILKERENVKEKEDEMEEDEEEEGDDDHVSVVKMETENGGDFSPGAYRIDKSWLLDSSSDEKQEEPS